jgi:hypothetical protein
VDSKLPEGLVFTTATSAREDYGNLLPRLAGLFAASASVGIAIFTTPIAPTTLSGANSSN